jgi:hypothetical protein
LPACCASSRMRSAAPFRRLGRSRRSSSPPAPLPARPLRPRRRR